MTFPKYPPKIAALVLGLKENTLRTYHLRGGLKTDNASEPGEHRQYTFRDLVCTAVMADLIRRGVSLKFAGEVVEDQRKHLLRNEFFLIVSEGLSEEEFYKIPGWRSGYSDWRRHGANHHGFNNAASVRDFIATDECNPVSILVAVHRIRQEIEARLKALYKPEYES